MTAEEVWRALSAETEHGPVHESEAISIIRAALRERDAQHEIALKKARADALEEAAVIVQQRRVSGWVPHGAAPAFAQLAQRIRSLRGAVVLAEIAAGWPAKHAGELCPEDVVASGTAAPIEEKAFGAYRVCDHLSEFTACADCIAAVLRERDARWAAALRASHYDSVDGPHVGCRDCEPLRALLEEAGK